MTGSLHDGEALNAIRLANRLLRDRNLTWLEVLGSAPTTNGQAGGYPEGYTAGFAAGLRQGAARAQKPSSPPPPGAGKRQPPPQHRPWKDRAERLLNDYHDYSSDLSDWEREFLTSMSERLWPLTEKQQAVLDRLWKRCVGTDPDEDGEPPF